MALWETFNVLLQLVKTKWPRQGFFPSAMFLVVTANCEHVCATRSLFYTGEMCAQKKYIFCLKINKRL